MAEEIPDYNKPFAPIYFDKPVYTWTDKVKITIIAPSWNSDKDMIDSIGDDNQNPIKISTRNNSLDQYRLTETDVRSGIFTGEVILTGFLHDTDGDGEFDVNPRTIGTGPTGGFLQVDRDSAVTVSFEFADGVVLTESVPLTWNLGTVNFTKKVFLSDESVIVSIIDPDMNLNPETLDRISVEIFSDSDMGGILVDAIETSESSGSFMSEISITQKSSSSGNRLYAKIGDKIYAKYDDYTLPKPYSVSENLEINASSIIDSSVPPIERLDNKSIILSDSLGNPLTSFSSNHQIQIIGTIENEFENEQTFVYLIQVKNSDDSVESLSWIQGQLSENQTLDVSQSWTPKRSGTFIIESFVWNSLNDPAPLSQIMSTLITVE